MRDAQFESLSNTLLRGGIAPRHVRRYMNELSDHYEDLLDAARKEGLSTAEGEARACAQLGAPDDLAKAMLMREDLKTLSARYPISVFGFGPLISFVLALFGVGMLMVAVALLGQALFGAKTSVDLTAEQLASIQALQPVFDGLAWFAKFVLPIVLGWLFVHRAIQQQADVRWVALGVVIISLVGGAADVSASLPSEVGVKGELQFGFGLFPPYPNADGSVWRSVINIVLLAPGLWKLAQLRKLTRT